MKILSIEESNDMLKVLTDNPDRSMFVYKADKFPDFKSLEKEIKKSIKLEEKRKLKKEKNSNAKKEFDKLKDEFLI